MEASPREAKSATTGVEILLYDPRRRPPDWTKIIESHQCAVFLRDLRLGVSVASDGQPRSADRATYTLFDSVEAAEIFCRRMLDMQPQISCEIVDAEGPANPPLMKISRFHSGGDDDFRGWL